MPLLDVSDLLTDPDLAGECFTVIRREQVNTNGIISAKSTPYPGILGSIIPQADSPMVRGPDQQALPRLLQVITQFRLRGISHDAQGNEYQPDFVVWHGDNYVVNKIYDWSHYGAGFICADCSSVVSVEAAPT